MPKWLSIKYYHGYKTRPFTLITNFHAYYNSNHHAYHNITEKTREVWIATIKTWDNYNNANHHIINFHDYYKRNHHIYAFRKTSTNQEKEKRRADLSTYLLRV